jgi:glycine dehydrogenase subunit 1
MHYLFNTPDDQRAMLDAIGLESIEDLFGTIPATLRLTRPLDILPAMGELQLTQHMSLLAAKNMNAADHVCFLGAGSYDHFIPAVVDQLAGRGEFYTSYTPYQPEVSQGNLQAMFEYQTLICQLSGMDVSNASLYDGGSAVAEAALMSLGVGRQDGPIVVAETVHPEYREILATYLKGIPNELVTVKTEAGVATAEQIGRRIDRHVACVIIQYPNFFGCIEDVQAIADATHQCGALLIVAFDPIAMGVLKRPGDLGADIAVAEGQSLGTPMSFGGPYLGIMACREEFVRRMPGRIAGQTVDRRGRRCWVLTLQTREQHIRREKATSNICTNQGLFALRASIYLATMGPRGLRQVAQLCLNKSHYAAQRVSSCDRFDLAWSQPFFKEFLVRDKAGNVQDLIFQACQQGILAGIPVGRWYPELNDCFLVTVTEKRTRAEIDHWIDCLSSPAGSPSTRYA